MNSVIFWGVVVSSCFCCGSLFPANQVIENLNKAHEEVAKNNYEPKDVVNLSYNYAKAIINDSKTILDKTPDSFSAQMESLLNTWRTGLISTLNAYALSNDSYSKSFANYLTEKWLGNFNEHSDSENNNGNYLCNIPLALEQCRFFLNLNFLSDQINKAIKAYQSHLNDVYRNSLSQINNAKIEKLEKIFEEHSKEQALLIFQYATLLGRVMAVENPSEEIEQQKNKIFTKLSVCADMMADFTVCTNSSSMIDTWKKIFGRIKTTLHDYKSDPEHFSEGKSSFIADLAVLHLCDPVAKKILDQTEYNDLVLLRDQGYKLLGCTRKTFLTNTSSVPWYMPTTAKIIFFGSCLLAITCISADIKWQFTKHIWYQYLRQYATTITDEEKAALAELYAQADEQGRLYLRRTELVKYSPEIIKEIIKIGKQRTQQEGWDWALVSYDNS